MEALLPMKCRLGNLIGYNQPLFDWKWWHSTYEIMETWWRDSH